MASVSCLFWTNLLEQRVFKTLLNMRNRYCLSWSSVEYFSLNLFPDILILEIIEVQSKILRIFKPYSLGETVDETIV